MRSSEVVASALRHRVLVRRDGDDLVLHGPFGNRLPDTLLQVLRARKAEVLAYLAWEERADTLLLESVRRLSALWPGGCLLDGPNWQRHEDALHVAYWSEDLKRLKTALKERERYALAVFQQVAGNEAS